MTSKGWAAQIQLRRARAALEAASPPLSSLEAPSTPSSPAAPSGAVSAQAAELGAEVAQVVLERLGHNVD